jgi:hypothetical protein
MPINDTIPGVEERPVNPGLPDGLGANEKEAAPDCGKPNPVD